MDRKAKAKVQAIYPEARCARSLPGRRIHGHYTAYVLIRDAEGRIASEGIPEAYGDSTGQAWGRLLLTLQTRGIAAL